MIHRFVSRLPAWAVRWIVRLQPGSNGEPIPAAGAGEVPDALTDVKIVTVALIHDEESKCAFRGCGQAADLRISAGFMADEPVPRPYCVDHWRSLRSLFIGRNDTILYGDGAPELIISRTSARLKGELCQLHPVEQPEEYNRVFCDLVVLEQQRRQGQA